MVETLQVLGVVLVLALLAYLLYLWSKRRDQISCPSCGGRVNIYADECPYCGHEKKDITEDIPAGEEAEDVVTVSRGSGEIPCPECGEGFESERGLRIHKGMVH